MVKRWQRLAVAVIVLLLIYVFAVLLNGKLQQRTAIAELLKQEHITVQFTDGEYCESISEARKRNWLTDSVDVIYFDIQDGDSSEEFLPLIERLPALSRVIIRYQGHDFEDFSLHRTMIQEKLARESSVVARAFPKLEVLTCCAVGEQN